MTARPTTRYHNKLWGSSIVSSPTFRPSTYSSGLDTSGTSSHQSGYALNLWNWSTACPNDYMCIALAVLYFLLMVRCLVLAREHHGWSNRQAQGLIWYLLCSLLMCACRMACFIMVPFLSLDCDSSYRVWAWETDGLAFGAVPWSAWPTSPTTTSTTSATSISSKGGNKVDTTSSLSNYSSSSSAHKGPVALALALLSSCALCLFFTSYTYFAHSLSRVLEMLTDHNNGSSGDSRILVLLLSLNICVWVSAGALALCLVASPQVQLYADSIARFSIALAAFCTSASFSLLFARALVFLWRQRQQENRDVGRAAQLTRLFRVRRIRGVLAVCTVVFLVRALVLVLHSHLTSLPFWSWAELVYLVLVEGAPTLYMLNAFRSSSLTDAAVGSMTAVGAKSPMNEFDVLKATLTSNLSVVSSPARTGFTSRYYATPEKSSVQSAQDAEERCRLLHTPGSEMSGFGGVGGGGGLDPLELERGAELYRL